MHTRKSYDQLSYHYSLLVSFWHPQIPHQHSLEKLTTCSTRVRIHENKQGRHQESKPNSILKNSISTQDVYELLAEQVLLRNEK